MSFSEIAAWAHATHRRPSAFEYEAIRQLDGAMLTRYVTKAPTAKPKAKR